MPSLAHSTDLKQVHRPDAPGSPGNPGEAQGTTCGPRLPRPRLAYAAAAEPPEPGRLPVLGRHMRRVLRAAVVWATEQGPARGCSHSALVVLLVLLAKTNRQQRVTRTSVPELADWLGASTSAVNKALAELRQAGAVETGERRNEEGEVVGLEARVTVPNPSAAHPLAVLGKPELATLLRTCEALFGPGWAPADGPETPPGLLAYCTGRGAATLRLALLRISLDTRADGRLRLAGGRAPADRGRAALTVGRLIGRTPSTGARVLDKLLALGLLTKTQTTATTGMGSHAVVRFPAAATAPEATGRLAPVETADPEIPGRAGTTVSESTPGGDAAPQVGGVPMAEKPEIPGRAATTDLHAVHASGVTAGGSPKVDSGSSSASGGHSAEGVGEPTTEGCAQTHEGETPLTDAGRPAPEDAPGGALRAEENNPSNSPVISWPFPKAVTEAVAPVWQVVEAIDSTGRRWEAGRAVRAVLRTRMAPQALADHLAARFAGMTLTDREAGRGYIRDPFRWLVSQLPQVTVCGSCGCTLPGAPTSTSRVCTLCTERRAALAAEEHEVDPAEACARLLATWEAQGKASETTTGTDAGESWVQERAAAVRARMIAARQEDEERTAAEAAALARARADKRARRQRLRTSA